MYASFIKLSDRCAGWLPNRLQLSQRRRFVDRAKGEESGPLLSPRKHPTGSRIRDLRSELRYSIGSLAVVAPENRATLQTRYLEQSDLGRNLQAEALEQRRSRR